MERDEAVSAIKRLQLALVEAQDKILKQDALLGELTLPPLLYATVVAVGEYGGLLRKLLLTDGTQVKIREDSPCYGDSAMAGVGVVQGGTSKKGFVEVRFQGGYGHYRIGLSDVDEGACDLELAEKSKLEYVDTATVSMAGKLVEVYIPQRLKINPGDNVTVTTQTSQIVDIVPGQMNGPIAKIKGVIDAKFSEVEKDSSTFVVFNGSYKGEEFLKKGDRVVLDGTGSVICRNLGKEKEVFNVEDDINVQWKDIGGLEEAKMLIREAIELPHLSPDVFAFYNKKPTSGILLYGKPGCGKTMIGKAVATSLAKIYKREGTPSGMIYVKSPEILNKYVGESEAIIRQLFQRAKKHKEDYGYPAVLFFDEAESIMGKRGSGVSSDMEKTIVPMFLAEMDGIGGSGAIVILATNRSDILDPAITRDGRIDCKIHITRPTPSSAKDIFRINLENKPIYNGHSKDEFATRASEQVFCTSRGLYEIQRKDGGDLLFTLGHLMSGGMAVNIIEHATTVAMRRDLMDKKKTKNKQRGLKIEDIDVAVNMIEKQNRDLNHHDALEEFTEGFKDNVASINKIRVVR